MGERATLVERLSAGLANRVGRRSFLARSAIVGSALTVAPADLLLRPTTAYAAVCSCVGENCTCGALCCDGYTEFCCSIYGANACPPGTAVAGWWKADGSGFCGGPRYYMDCNAGCGGCGCDGSGLCSGACSGTGCGCANGNCNERRAGCNEFRYGQCNQAIPCLGPIVCRLVSCIPPWEIEASCTTTPATDDSTGPHDAPCLHVAIGGIHAASVTDGVLTVTGWALDPDVNGPIPVDIYVDGAYVERVLANQPWSDGVLEHNGHGFVGTMAVSSAGHSVCAYAINEGPGSTNPLLGCLSVAPALVWNYRYSLTTGVADVTQVFGDPGDLGVAGHWHAGAADSPAAFRDGRWRLRDSLLSTAPDTIITYGTTGDLPLAGDWNGDGADTIGVYRNGIFYLRNSNTSGEADLIVPFGNPGDHPVTGDWNGTGLDTIGVFRNGVFYLRYSNTPGPADLVIPFGEHGRPAHRGRLRRVGHRHHRRVPQRDLLPAQLQHPRRRRHRLQLRQPGRPTHRGPLDGGRRRHPAAVQPQPTRSRRARRRPMTSPAARVPLGSVDELMGVLAGLAEHGDPAPPTWCRPWLTCSRPPSA